MKVKETENGLEVVNVPGCMWILGGFFTVIGSIFIYGFLGGFSNYDEVERWEIILGMIITVSVTAVGIWVILSHPVTITKINALEKKVTISEKGIFKRETRELKFSEVLKFGITEEQDSDGDSFYYLFLQTNRGEKLKLSRNGLQGEEYAEEICDNINRYLTKEKLLEK